MKAFRSFLFFIFTIVLIAGILSIQVLLVPGQRVREPDFYLDKFEKYGVYDDVQKYLSSRLGSLVTEKSISQKLSNDVITRDWVVGETGSFVRGMISYLESKTGELPVINYNPAVERLVGNVGSIIKDLGIINPIGTAVTNSLKKNLDAMMPDAPFSSAWNERDKSKFINTAKIPRFAVTNIPKALYISVGAILFSLIMLWLLQNKPYSKIRAIGAGMLFGGLIGAVLSAIALGLFKLDTSGMMAVLLNSVPSSLLDEVPSIQPVMVSIIEDLLYPVLICGTAFTAIGIVFMIVSSSMERGRRNIGRV